MYTKGEMVDQIYLKVVGGSPSDDVDVQRVDIEPFLAAAINYAMVKEIRIRKREKAALGEWDTSLDPEFVATYFSNIKYDDQRGLRYIDLPVRIQALPSNAGLQDIFAPKAKKNFIKLRGPFEAVGVTPALRESTLYWYENVGEAQRVYFRHLSNTVQEVAVRAVASIQDLEDQDIVPVPPGLEMEVINLCVDFFTGQRQMPEDSIVDNKDNK